MADFYGLMVIVGPIILAAVLLWAVLNNRRSRRDEQRTEAATRDMYAAQERSDKAEERG